MLALVDRLAGWWMDWRTGLFIKGDPDLEFEIEKFKVIQHEQGWSTEMVGSMRAVAVFADQAAELLRQHDAENYVEFEMLPRLDRAQRPIRVTVQWATGALSPAKKATRLKERVELLEGILGECWETIMDLVNQHCQIEPGLVSDYALSANEDAFTLLQGAGLLEETEKTGRYRLVWENLEPLQVR